ncbi:MAG: hypothetical protein ACR2I4_05405 [Actinomycetota bacterium]
MTCLVVAAATLLLMLAPSSSQRRPAEAQEVAPYLPVTIQAVPPIEGVRFLLDGRSLTTDHNGLAFSRLRRAGSHNLTAPDQQRVEPGRRVHFAHWSDGDFPSVRKLSVTTFTSLEVGFDVSYSTPVDFVSSAGAPIAAEKVDSVTIIDDRDTGYSLEIDGPQWLPGSRALESGGSIRSEEISYVVDAVVVGGSDRLMPGQPPFRPSPDQSWSIVLEDSAADEALSEPSAARRSSATSKVVFEVSDALFGFPTGSAVSIEGPDGRSERHELGPGARLSLEQAGAGDFRATALGPGISFAQRFDPSRAERVRLSVITYLDIAIGLLTLVLVAAGALALTRRIGSSKPQRGSPIVRARPWFTNTRDRAKATPGRVPAPAHEASEPQARAAAEPSLVPSAAAEPLPSLGPSPEPFPAVDIDTISDLPRPATTPAPAEAQSRAVELASEAETALAEARTRAQEILAEAENSLTEARKRAREIMQRAIEEAHRQTIELSAQAEAAVAEAREQAVEIMGEAARDARGLREMAEREAAELLRHALRRRNEIQDATARGAGGRGSVAGLESSDLEDSTESAQPRPGVTIKISDVSLLEDQVEPAPARSGRQRR